MRLVELVRGLLRGTVSEEAGCTGGLVIVEKMHVFKEQLWRVIFLRPSGLNVKTMNSDNPTNTKTTWSPSSTCTRTHTVGEQMS